MKSTMSFRPMHLLLVVYVAVLYAFILPAHTHQDLQEHHGCALCQLSNLTAVTESAPVIAFCATLILATLTAGAWKTVCSTSTIYNTRAPPVC